jgi:nucleotide-binding universal stress UspA family protein
MFEKILVPISPSKEAEKQIQIALNLAKRFNSKLHIVSVSLAGEIEESFELKRREVEKFCQRIKNEGVSATHDVVRFEGKRDELSSKICELGENYDLIVMGHYKFDKIYRFLHQSNAQDVINMVSCPVIVVPF